MKTSLSRAAGLCALLASTALTGLVTAPARAQSASNIPPPVRFQVDENGVDVARATFIGTRTDIDIGSGGPGALAMIRRFGQGVGGHSYDLGLYFDGASWKASLGLQSYAFAPSGTAYVSTDGSGATLVKSGSAWTLTTGEGVKVVYDYNLLDSLDGTMRKSRGTSITYPTGEKVTLTYVSESFCVDPEDICGYGTWNTAVRLQSVGSSLGYQLHFNHGADQINMSQDADPWREVASINAINTFVDACNPAAAACSFTRSWPTVTYSGDEVTDPIGRTTRYTNIASDARSFSIRLPSSTSDDIVYNLDNNSRVTSVVRQGGTWAYAYGVSGNVATMTRTDPLGHQRAISSNLTIGLPTAVTDELGRTTSYQYDASGRLARATAPEGNYVEYIYDARGNVTQMLSRAKEGSGVADIVVSASYSSACANALTCNQPVSTTDARGNTTEYAYADHGGLLTATLPAPAAGAAQPQTRVTYDALAAPGGGSVYRPVAISFCQTASSCAGTADEVKTTIGYDANINPATVSTGAGDGSLTATSTTAYDAIGNPATVDGPLAGGADTVRYRYDAARQAVGTVSADPDGTGALKHRAERITYNSKGQVTKTENGTVDSQSDAHWAAFSPLEALEIDYDSRSRPVTQKLVAGGTTHSLTQISYDAAGRVECQAQRMNSAAWATQTDACLPNTLGSHGPDRITKTIYNAAGEVTQVKSALGTADEANEVTTTYTANGNAQTLTDAENNKTTYEYDGHDRLTKTRFPHKTQKGTSSSATGPDADYEHLSYEVLANGTRTSELVVQRRLRDGQVIGFGYDALNRVTLKDLPGAEPDVSYGYDNLGRLISASQSGHPLSFTYDALGRNLTQAGPLGTLTSAYDLMGRRTRLTYPGGGLYVDQDHLVTGEVTKIRENGAATGAGVLASLVYDNLGKRTLLTRGNGTSTSYGYDAVSRLQTLTQDVASAHDLTLGFTYNKASQIVGNTRSTPGSGPGQADPYAFTGHSNGTVGSTFNGLNQLLTHGTANITHDTRGNLTSDGVKTYGYSSENLLTSAAGGYALAYDPMMRLHQLAGSATTRFGYDGLDLIAEYDSANTLQRRYVHGPGTDEPLVWYEGSGTSERRYVHADERGSIVAVSDSSGSVIGVNRYDEYGKPQGPSGAGTLLGRFGYTGQSWLPEVGLYNYKARMYNPKLQMFMQTDPIGYRDGMNMYAYVGRDPVNFTDPYGLDHEGTIIVCGNCWENSDSGIGGFSNIGGVGTGTVYFDQDPRQLARDAREEKEKEEEEITVTGSRIRPRQIGSQPTFSRASQQQGRQDYCGAAGSSLPIPDSVGGINLRGACATHDNCYGTLGSNRLTCDRALRDDIFVSCIRQGGYALGCGNIAIIYFGGVRLGGVNAFRDAQLDAFNRWDFGGRRRK